MTTRMPADFTADSPQVRAHKPLKPKDAATLIVLDRSGPAPRVLMGKRHEKHRFMPGKFVFPGGRLDAGDRHIAPVQGFDPSIETKLLHRMRGRSSPRKARALGLAAIRELYEETGLLVGEKVDALPQTKDKSWHDFLQHGVAPSLGGFMLIARAITPPRRPRRFDARFFAVDADHIAERAAFTEDDASELLEINWLTLAEARAIDIPNITRIVLDHLEHRLAARDPFAHDHKVPFYFMRGRNFVREEL